MLVRDNLSDIRKLILPARYQVDSSRGGLTIKRLTTPEREVNVQLEPYNSRGATCRRVLVRTEESEQYVLEFAAFSDVYGGDVECAIRSRRPIVEGDILKLDSPRFREDTVPVEDTNVIFGEIHNSWTAGIRYNSELTNADGSVFRSGFRQPQSGALHSIASHWTLSDEPATVVMPTGTGKTEVMIATAVGSFCRRLLVIVPTDALRQQTADKFATYGILKKIGVIDDLPYPIIGLLSSGPTQDHIAELSNCNVVVSTMSSIGRADESTQRDFARLFSHVFFDEAHHIEAATWKRFQKHCKEAKSLFLTATPFREDGKSLEGKIIYSYPLSAAQEEGYFKPINFVEVFEPNARDADRRIAEAAVGRLREDISNGFDHILMARAQSISAAQELFDNIYQPQHGDLNPVLIHSKTPSKRTVLQAIRGGQHKIVICVDMFGEGFDLPSLKVAALHSVHKSLGITLQFIGRFARTSTGINLGSATFIANTADDGVPESLESLYYEDANWNDLLADLSYDAIEPQERLSELVNNLEPMQGGESDMKISNLALRPKISTCVYRTNQFHPDRFRQAFRSKQYIYQPQISRRDNIIVIIVNQKELIDWTDSKDIALDTWDLYIAYFDAGRELLYVHCSRKGDSTGRFAKSISHEPSLIKEEETFKVFSGLRRLTLHSVGLSSRSRNVRYQMFAGLDVRSAIDPVLQQSKLKSNITGVGYEEGERRNIGCSRKGKIWSMTSGSLAQWRSWCDMIGAKLSDTDSQPNDFLRFTLIPQSIASLPQCRALMVDWPDQLFAATNFRFEVISAASNYGFDDCQIDLVEWNQGGDSFQFRLQAGADMDVTFRQRLLALANGDESYEVEFVSGQNMEINAAGKRQPAVDFFNENPVLVRLEDGSQISGNILLKPQEELPDTYDRNAVQTIDWNGVDITKESRWKDGVIRQNSVQQKFIDHLAANTCATFIVDDDDTGESADVVAIEETADKIIVFLWHCKYSSGVNPGNRAADLYEVCGQAQKSIKWTWNLRTLIKHLTNREANHKRGRDSRFIKGSTTELVTLRKSARRKFIEYRIGVVQPGIVKSNIPVEHLAIIGSTNSFVQCITGNPLSVISSS